MNDRLSAALVYARKWRVFPVGADKRPLTQHGLKDATQNEDQINAWWALWPDANVALDLPTNIAVIDIDPRNGATAKPSDFATTRVVQTPGMGWHLYYRVPEDVALRGQYGQGIDVKRGGKGYVLAPPSVNAEGVAYVLIASGEPTPMPEEMLTALRKDAPKPTITAEGFHYSLYGQRALENECGRMALAREGGRNQQLNKSAFAVGQLVAGGELEEHHALEELHVAAERAGLDAEEVHRTIASGFDAGVRDPRSAPEQERQPAAATAGDPGSPFVPVDPNTIRPPRQMLQTPFLYEAALTWLWGPSGHGKSMALDKAITDLSNREIHACLWDWEDTSMEVERLVRLGANFEYAHVFTPREGDDIYDFGSGGFVDRIIATVEHYHAKLVMLNPFWLLVPPPSREDPDAWNSSVKSVVNSCRRIIAETGAAVVVTDHQENTDAEHAHGGKSKKALTDLYIRVTSAGPDYVPGRPYHFQMVNLKQAREHLPPMTAEVTGEHRGSKLKVKWGNEFAVPESKPLVPLEGLSFRERLAKVRGAA